MNVFLSLKLNERDGKKIQTCKHKFLTKLQWHCKYEELEGKIKEKYSSIESRAN